MKGIGLKRRGLVIGSMSREGCFLLRDEFLGDAPAPLQTPRFCYQGPGTLVLDQTDGQFSIVGGEFVWPVQGTPAWGDQDFYALDQNGQAFARALGRVLKKRLILTTAATCWTGWALSTAPALFNTNEQCFYHKGGTPGWIFCVSGNGTDSGLQLKDAWPANQYQQAAIVLSPYDVNGLHWYPGATGHSGYGAHFFWRDESGADSWRLVWYRQLQNTAPLYPALVSESAAGRIDYARIPCNTLENELLTPIAWDEFTDTNGVTLPNHTMTYGGLSWVNQAGVWTIQGNEAVTTAVANAVSYTDLSKADVWWEKKLTIGADAVSAGVVVRKSVDTGGNRNEWRCYIQTGVAGNDTFIDEVDNGVVTNRAVADNDWAQGDFNIRIRCDAQQITMYINYVEVAHFAAAAFNETATWFGLYVDNDANQSFDFSLSLPRGTLGEYDAALDSF